MTEVAALDRDGKAVAREIKSIVKDDALWLKMDAMLSFLQPITRLSTLMSRDLGESIPFYFIGLWGIQRIWDSQPRDRRRRRLLQPVGRGHLPRGNVDMGRSEAQRMRLDALLAGTPTLVRATGASPTPSPWTPTRSSTTSPRSTSTPWTRPPRS